MPLGILWSGGQSKPLFVLLLDGVGVGDCLGQVWERICPVISPPRMLSVKRCLFFGHL